MAFSPELRQGRRAFLLTLVSALAVVACSTGPHRGALPPVPQGPARNRVALLAPLTGQDAALGQALANAARLALADTGNQSIELKVYNTDAGGAAAAANRALGEGAQLILGPLLSDQVRAVAPITRQARVPVLAFSNDETAAGSGVYILGFVPSQAVSRAVRQARTSGAGRFAALAPATTYAQRATADLPRTVERAGGQLVGMQSYGSLAEARAGLRRLNAAGYDALLIADSARTAATIAPQVLAGARIVGPDLWAGERGLGRTPRLRRAVFAAPSDVRFNQLASRYRARYGANPPRLASLGYDAVLLGVRATKNWKPGRRFPVDALKENEGFVGVDGVFRFTAEGVAERGLEVRQVSASGTTVISPAPAHF
ncbi:penicillin-binding protein activator [Sphingomonas sp. BN140010]|uniref:Penicillin-binding protein activator n=1 Tax=Sphingomonas arvum TaxID=2992113 RepID=A0ABT3JHW9_9SPHN|nr:penicillin-binding protein activator [Sphingomonas sp. BN140010]MCW3798657.1 penicillin-binding protein activator [Sphingomonas sp. BN140010]